MSESPPTERVILVTGASSGIGAAVCRRLAAPGARIVAHARSGLDETVAHLRDAGAEAEACLADLAEPGAAAQLVGFAAETFGGLDQIVSNAGFADPTRFGEVSRGELDRSLATMTGAFFDLATAALPHLRKSRRGRVVAISSFVAHAFPADYLFPVTAAAKGGLEALARTLARQLAADGVTVNCVAPGFTRKDKQGHSSLGGDAWQRAAELTPMGRIADPDDIAALVAFLLGPEARHITGQVIHVDGGLGLG
ncbi:MAG: SDR family oxidoreductase [Magnetovibrio sp.]|nr:SDR family oxidoreductase [Magnetovibrio sp.]